MRSVLFRVVSSPSIQVQAANKSGVNSVFSLSFRLQSINRVVVLDKISRSVKLNSEVQKHEYGALEPAKQSFIYIM